MCPLVLTYMVSAFMEILYPQATRVCIALGAERIRIIEIKDMFGAYHDNAADGFQWGHQVALREFDPYLMGTKGIE